MENKYLIVDRFKISELIIVKKSKMIAIKNDLIEDLHNNKKLYNAPNDFYKFRDFISCIVELWEMLEYAKFNDLKDKNKDEYESISQVKDKFSNLKPITILESFKAYDNLRLFIKLSGYDEDSMKEESEISDEPQFF